MYKKSSLILLLLINIENYNFKYVVKLYRMIFFTNFIIMVHLRVEKTTLI